MDEPSQAMKKGPSHRPCGRFSRDCCVKNTQPFWASLGTRVRAAAAAVDREKPLKSTAYFSGAMPNELRRRPLSRRNYQPRLVVSVRRPSDAGLMRPAPQAGLRGPVGAIRRPLIRLKTCDLDSPNASTRAIDRGFECGRALAETEGFEPIGPGCAGAVSARSDAQSASPRAKIEGSNSSIARWRRRRDSNPRYAFGAYNGLANRRLQPLGHVSSARRNGYRNCLVWSNSAHDGQRLRNFRRRRHAAWPRAQVGTATMNRRQRRAAHKQNPPRRRRARGGRRASTVRARHAGAGAAPAR